jgi:hypothetical protein
MRTRRQLCGRGAASLLIALVTFAVPVAAEARIGSDVPVSQIHGLAKSYLPGALLPTRFPASITTVNVGMGSGIGGGPPPARLLTYHSRTVSAFQLAIWKGARKASVVAGLLKHDGAHGSARAFTAGRFVGTLEIQDNVFTKPRSWVASYVWQAGGYTYLVMVRERPGGKTIYPGLVPLTTIASFKP